MGKSLSMKLIYVILLLMALLIIAVGTFLVQGVRDFYLQEFYKQMDEVFSNEEFSSGIRAAADAEDIEWMEDVLSAYSGQLGIDAGTRNFYILDGEAGECLAGSDMPENPALEITPNILAALAGREGVTGKVGAAYMDVAVPVDGKNESYIVYIIDNKQTVQDLTRELITIIIEALGVALIISVITSIIVSKTMLRPIQGMTHAAEEMAKGDFSSKIEVESDDEIGILADTFNNMADQLHQTLDEIRRSEELRKEFVANVSHELRTPITSIRSYAETLVDSDELPKEMEQNFLRVIMTESDRMTKIVQDLLELSRFDAGSSQMKFDKFSLEQSVRDIYNALVIEAQKRGQQIELELEWKMPDIIGDRSRIEQVLMNVVSNAIKYTANGGRIEITGTATGESVSVRVQDNGVGISKEDMARVFDRFYRVDKARSRESGGTGLGLSIAKEIIDRHDGRITIDSEHGKGTAVTITLPVGGPKDA